MRELEIRSSDDAISALSMIREDLLAWQSSKINEADTRAKIIDRLMKDVLGWDENAIRREQRTVDGEYLDYVFDSSMNRFIVEAKRVGAYFEFPVGISTRARRNGILAKSPALYQALTQAVEYCQSKEMPVGVVSNGLQLAVTLVLPVTPGGYDTLFFDGIGKIEASFLLFWNLLSPAGHAEDRLRQILAAPDFIRAAPQYSGRILDTVHLPDESMDRNPVDVALAPVITRYFSDLTGEDKEGVLQRAYVESGRQASYGKQVDALLADHIPLLGPKIQRVETTKKEAPVIDSAFLNVSAEEASVGTGRILLFVGGVGAGKTTFEHRYFKFLMRKELRGRIRPIFLDFTQAGEQTDLGTFSDAAVLDFLSGGQAALELSSWETLLHVYGKEIENLRGGVLAPYWTGSQQRFWELVSDQLQKFIAITETHIARIMEYVRGTRGIDFCVVFDNVDQLPQELQHRAISVAFQKCRLWKCFGMLTLREETYWRFRASPPLDAFHRHTYHIAAPKVANVLSRRLELAQLEQGDQSIAVRTVTGVLEFQGISVGQFLQIIVDSFLGAYRENIMLLEALGSGDIRESLSMFNDFLLSGHTNTDEYIKTYILSGSYFVPYHAVVRSVALGERRYYDSSKSAMTNLFSIEDDGFYSHFQKIRILRYLLALRQTESAPGRGFVDVGSLARTFQAVMSDEEGLRRVLDPLLQHRLIEAANGYRTTGERADSVRVTAAGAYYLNTLMNEVTYLDLVTTDTPIKSRPRFDELRQAAFNQKRQLREAIGERIDKVRVFLTYLSDEEESEREHMMRSGLPDVVTAPIMQSISRKFERRVPKILFRAKALGRDRPRQEAVPTSKKPASSRPAKTFLPERPR